MRITIARRLRHLHHLRALRLCREEILGISSLYTYNNCPREEIHVSYNSEQWIYEQ